MYYLKVFIFSSLLFFIFKCKSQYISNPSFEWSADGFAYGTPPGWECYNNECTLDTQPDIWNVSAPATDGNYYMGMSARGYGMYTPKHEAARTQLLKPLQNGNCYVFLMDLFTWPDVRDGLYNSYPDPLKLQIWGGNEANARAELLAETDYITNISWQNYSFILQPKNGTYNYFMLETIVDTNARGYILVDNLILNSYHSEEFSVLIDTAIRPDNHIFLNATEGITYNWSPSEGLSCADCRSPQVNIETSQVFQCIVTDSFNCPFKESFIITVNVRIPNVFTPNNDGFNDFFRIEGLQPNSSVTIFDRSGKIVYNSNNYDNNWFGLNQDGTQLSSGTYWYLVDIPGEFQIFTGYVFIKR